MTGAEINKLNKELAGFSAEENIEYFIKKYKNKITFATSLGAEDQIIIEIISRISPVIKIFTLDTGRLFPQTYDLLDRTNKKFNINIQVQFPDYNKVEKMVNEKGINLFFESIENRKLCCNVRKIEPLKRALKGYNAWISGLRRGQSDLRSKTQLIEWDKVNEIIKINPLYNWTDDMVWDYIREKKIPYNPLHDKGYPSIGCQPCTRAIFPGEDNRAGRWWWENTYTRECGLHKNMS